jgi:NADPH2:quinone reductase
MRAALCRELGPPSTLRIEELPDLVAAPGQVIVAVQAAGVNYVDALFIEGRYQIKPALPFVPGSEIAGTVQAVGPDLDSERIGTSVLASVGLGGFASQVALRADAAVERPAELDAPRGATFTQSYATALFSLRERGRLQSGETLLVLGGGGGVGLAAIDVGRSLGASVIATGSSEAKRTAAATAGAAHVLDPGAESLKERVRELTDGRGADMVLDPVGGALAEPALRSLGYDGRYLVIGFASGEIPSLPLNQVLLRNRNVVGVDWGAWALSHGPEQRVLLDELLGWVEAGRLHPVAPTTFALEDVAEALMALTQRRVVGKVAVLP